VERWVSSNREREGKGGKEENKQIRTDTTSAKEKKGGEGDRAVTKILKSGRIRIHALFR